MLKKQMEQYIKAQLNSNQINIELYKEEIDFAKKYQLIPKDMDPSIIEKDPSFRFKDAYIERCDKETENTIGIEDSTFLAQPISYLINHRNEFIYLESDHFAMIGVDAISLEMDDVFGAYDVMLGLKLQKKFEKSMNTYLKAELNDGFELLFNNDDGLWDLNIALNNISGFKEEISVGEAYHLIYSFLFHLVETVEN